MKKLVDQAVQSTHRIYSDRINSVNTHLNKARSKDGYATNQAHQDVMRKVNGDLKALYDGLSKTMTRSTKQAVRSATSETYQNMNAQEVNQRIGLRVAYTEVDKIAHRVIAENLSYLKNHINKMRKDIQTILNVEYTQILRRSRFEGITRTQAVQTMRRELVSPQLSTHFVDRMGRKWDSSKYFEMLLATVVSNAYREAIEHIVLINGNDLVLISTHNAVDACSKWEGKIMSLTGATPGYPTYQELKESRDIWHPRCRHFYTPININKAQE